MIYLSSKGSGEDARARDVIMETIGEAKQGRKKAGRSSGMVKEAQPSPSFM